MPRTRRRLERFPCSVVTACAVAIFLAACSRSSSAPAAPTAPAGPLLALTVTTGLAGIAVHGGRPPAVHYSACANVRNISDDLVTFTYEMEILDASGAVYPTFAFAPEPKTLPPGSVNLGCGMATAYDYDFTHPVANQYRLRVRPYSASGVATPQEGTGAFREPLPTLPPRVVINEFRTRGPNGHDDQFIELFNSSLSPAPMGGTLAGGPNSNFSDRGSSVSVPEITIGPLCHYLVASSGFTGRVTPDLTMPAFLTDDGHMGYGPRTSANTTQRDTVGMNGYSYEGTPLPPFPPENIDRSYVRIGVDTNDNLRDFAQRAGTPQNSSSCGTR